VLSGLLGADLFGSHRDGRASAGALYETVGHASAISFGPPFTSAAAGRIASDKGGTTVPLATILPAGWSAPRPMPAAGPLANGPAAEPAYASLALEKPTRAARNNHGPRNLLPLGQLSRSR
jgi:hypothetical protein